MTLLDRSKTWILVKIGPLWAWQNLRGYGTMVHAKFWRWGMLWDAIYDHLGPMLCAKVQILIDEIFLTWPYGDLQGWFLVFYYWISYEKSESGYTSSGGWTFCEFVDFRLFLSFWKSERMERSERSERSTGLGRYLIFFLMKFHVECRQNHVWGPPGARVISIFVKTYIFGKDALGGTHG